ncbi:MAG: hypothetical protein Q4C87_05710 [Actinomycetaceae bacterium]|nr:hypothetical protein [Actinomycetaceae bacterium]
MAISTTWLMRTRGMPITVEKVNGQRVGANAAAFMLPTWWGICVKRMKKQLGLVICRTELTSSRPALVHRYSLICPQSTPILAPNSSPYACR